MIFPGSLISTRNSRAARENSASEAESVCGQLTPLLKAGIAFLGLQHERKSGGEIFDAGRGTSAFGGDADSILRLTRPEGNQRPTLRVLEYVGRFRSGMAEPLMVEWEGGSYHWRGTVQAATAKSVAERIASLLPLVPGLVHASYWQNQPDDDEAQRLGYLAEDEIIDSSASAYPVVSAND